MGFDRLNQWLSLIANLGVALGLVLLLVELNQNTRVSEIEAYQVLINQIVSINQNVQNNPELLEIVVRIEGGGQPETAEENQLFFGHAMNIFRHGDMAYYQYENGLIDEPRLRSVLSLVIGTIVRSDRGREIWDSTSQFPQQYKNYVSGIVSASGK